MPGIFDEQLLARGRADEEMFSEAFERVSGAVLDRDSDPMKGADDALEEVARFYRAPFPSMPEEREKLGDTLEKKLENLFRPVGIMRREVSLTGDWYRDAAGAYLGTTRDGHTVALLPYWGGYRYRDHATGKTVHLNRRTAKNLKPEAVSFYRSLPLRKLGVLDLAAFLTGSISFWDVARLTAITLLVTLISMVAPWLTRNIYAQGIYAKDDRTLIAVFVFLVCSGAAATLLQIGRGLALARIQVKADVSVRAAVMARLINLPVGFFQHWASGDLARRAEGLNMLCQTVARTVFDVGMTALMSLIYARQILQFAPALVAPALATVAALLILSVTTMRVQSKVIERGMQLKAKEQGLLYALITGIQKLKLAGAERRGFAKWAAWYAEDARLSYNPPLLLRMESALRLGITLAGTFVMYARALSSGVSPEDYMAFMASWGLLSGAFLQLNQAAISAATLGPILTMVQPILEAVPEVEQGKKDVRALRGEIELANVTFRYDRALPPVLQNLSLKIAPGEYVGVVGHSGCGKSTLVRLLLGFEQPQNGIVCYDGMDLKWLDLKSLRSHIGCVMQNSRLFPGSILSNILISAPDKTEEDAWKAAELAGVAEDIRAMPMKMNTMISEGMGTISGGQRQRLIIARAIAPRPGILLFDEATSALDNLTQKTVSESLDSLKCTRIVIAHRLTTVRRCDRILVLDGGRIAEEGTYESLMEKKGLFATLVEGQRAEEGRTGGS